MEPTPQQSEVLHAINREIRLPPEYRKNRFAIASGAGIGKTAMAGGIGTWRLMREPDAPVFVSAPTWRQFAEVWSVELQRNMTRAPEYVRKLFRFTQKKIRVMGSNKWAITYIPADEPAKAQGIHHPNMTIMLDEAVGIPRQIVEVFKSTSTDEDNAIFAFSNPNTRDSAFYDWFNFEKDEWHLFTFSSYDSPLTDKSKLDRMVEEFGWESDVVRVKIRGLFPLGGADAILIPHHVEQATQLDPMERRLHYGGWRYRFQIGIDLARFGDDESVVMMRQGSAIVHWKAFTKTEPVEVLEYAMEKQRELEWPDDETLYVADANGIGGGAMIALKRAGKRLHEFAAQGSSPDRLYANKGTHAWFSFKALTARQGIALPNDRQLITQLQCRQYVYKMDDRGRAALATTPKKQKVMKDQPPSPDRAEAVVLACYNGIEANAKILHGGGKTVRIPGDLAVREDQKIMPTQRPARIRIA